MPASTTPGAPRPRGSRETTAVTLHELDLADPQEAARIRAEAGLPERPQPGDQR